MDVYFAETMVKVPVEIQIRDILIDSWAVLEHRMRYKPDQEPSQEVIDEMLKTSEQMHEISSRLGSLWEEMSS